MSDTTASPDTLPCPSCGALNPEGANFCQDCGRTLGSSPAESPSSSETIAFRTEDLEKLRAPTEQAPTLPESADGQTVAYKSDIGKKYRVNQDSGGAWSWMRDDGTPACLLIVADGVSAGRSSERASRLAVDVVYEQVSAALQDTDVGADAVLSTLVDAIKDANHQIAGLPHAAISSADATTIVTAFAVGTRVAGAWVGDSRVYRVSGDDITRLTVDHSWAEGVVNRGLMTVEQAASDPRAHMIMRWLGPPDQDDPGVESFLADLDPGDIVFCCTDGLYMYFAPPVARADEMARIISAHPDNLSGAVDQLVDSALARGGYDNITVAAFRVEDSPVTDEKSTETQQFPSLSSSDTAHQTVRLRFPLSEDMES